MSRKTTGRKPRCGAKECAAGATRRGRHGIMRRLAWACLCLDEIVEQAAAARKAHKKIEIGEVFANALLANVAQALSGAGVDAESLPAVNLLRRPQAKTRTPNRIIKA